MPAGLAGVSFAIAALRHESAPSIKHLRSINPHVVAALGDWRKHHHMHAFLPRQASAASSGQLSQMAGTSSMGMSGVNAHLLVSKSLNMAASDSNYVSPAQHCPPMAVHF